jgi:hypothetical protein
MRNEEYTFVTDFCKWDLMRFQPKTYIFTEEAWFHLGGYIHALTTGIGTVLI